MPFPNSPSNGELATVNNLVYVYNGTKGVWNKANVAAPLITNSISISGSISTSSNLSATGMYIDATSSSDAVRIAQSGTGNALVVASGNLVITSNIASTDTTTGALIVTGGVGVSGNINASGSVGIGRTAEATYQLDISNPSTTSGADTYVRASSLATEGDGDCEFIADAGGTGEPAFRLRQSGVSRGVLFASGDLNDVIQIQNSKASNNLYMLGADTPVNDVYSLRYTRDGGEAPVTGITGNITSSANQSTITGLSTTTGLYVGMVLTKTAGTGVLGTQACIQSIDSATEITVLNGFAAMTAGSITFTATPTPTTITAYSSSAGTWAVDQDFARFAFANGDSSGAGDGGIKASINAYVSDTGGTGTGLDLYVSSNGTTLTKGIRLDQNANLQFNSGYGSVATAYGCRAWVNFDGTGTNGTNQTIRGSGGVTTVAKSTGGLYAVNLAFTMPDVNYGVNATCNPNAYGGAYAGSGSTAGGTNSTTVVYVELRDTSNANTNSNYIWVSVHR